MIFLLLVVIVITVAYYLLKKNYDYWKVKGVPGPEPSYIVGNVGQSLIFKKSMGDLITEIYYQYQHLPMVGIFRGFSPFVIIRDPEIIKDITVKEFSHFHDNDFEVDDEIDPLIGRNPFFMKGEKWKIVRSQLTPCFTSGKMKSLYPLLEDISQRLVKFIDREYEQQSSKENGLEAKELCTKFTLNNVAACAFGLEGKCFEDPNSEFRQIAKKFLSPSGWTSIIFILALLVPSITKLFKLRLVPKDVEDKLLNIVTETLRHRKENNIERNDFLQIISQLKETCKDYEFTDLDVTAHAASFFGDGYETSSIVMSFLVYELASNSEVQKKLRAEIEEGFLANNGTVTYEKLQSMPYLDACFNELLRMHPVIQFLMKLCTKPYTYNPKPGDGIHTQITIDQDTSVALPLGGLHSDPKYFEKPEEFVPERFLGDNKKSINRFAYLPFGEGPRACLGQRFASLQIKIGIAYIIKNYEISVNKKTKRPLKYDPYYFMRSPIGGLWIDYTKI